MQDLPFNELIFFAYAADRTPRPTYVYLPSGLYHARTGRVLPQSGPSQEITPLPGIYFFDGWRAQPTLDIPVNQSTCQAPRRHQHMAVEQPRLPLGVWNQPDPLRRRHGTYLPQRPRTNRKMDPALAGLLSVHVNTLEQWLANMAPNYRQYMMPRRYMHNAAEEAQQLKTTQYRQKESELPVVAPELTSELLHCLSTLPDPWPLAKITINMDTSMESAFQAVQNALPKLENRVIEFLAEWLVALLAPARHVLETRSPHLSFMLLKEYWFRELYLGLKVTAFFDRTESYNCPNGPKCQEVTSAPACQKTRASSDRNTICLPTLLRR